MCYDLLLLFLQGEVMEEHEDVRRNIAEKVSYSVIYDDIGQQQQATGKKLKLYLLFK